MSNGRRSCIGTSSSESQQARSQVLRASQQVVEGAGAGRFIELGRTRGKQTTGHDLLERGHPELISMLGKEPTEPIEAVDVKPVLCRGNRARPEVRHLET